MFKVGDKVIWDGRVPYGEDNYSALKHKEQEVFIAKIDLATRMNYQIATRSVGIHTTWWVNRENIQPV